MAAVPEGGGGEEESVEVLKKRATEYEERIVGQTRRLSFLKGLVEEANLQYEAEVNRRTTAEMILRDLSEQEKILQILGIMGPDTDGSFEPSLEQCESFWNMLSEERQKSLEMQTFNEDLKKRASVLAKERAIYQRQKEQLQSLVVSYVREKGGENSDSTLKQQLQSLYYVYVMEEKCRQIYCRPAKDLPVHIDIPRLVRSFEISQKDQQLFSPNPKSSVPECVHLLLCTLTKAVEGEKAAQELGKTYEEIVLMKEKKEDEKDDFQKSLSLFLQHPKSDSWACVGILKACNQAIIAPYVTRLKSALDVHLPFNSARNGWRITIEIGTEKVVIIHRKKEIAAPEAVDLFGEFEFEWKLEIGLELDSMTIGNTYAGIDWVQLGVEKEIKDEVGKQIFHNDIVDFKDILRTCLCDPDDSSDIEKKVKRLKDKIHRHQIKLKEKTGREEEKRRRAKKEAQNRQKKELMKLKKTMESGELLEGEKLKMYEALSALNEEK